MILSALFAAAVAATPPTAAAVLAANHAAVGPLPAKGAARFDYALSSSGLEGEAVSLEDLASGAYVDSEVTGPVSDASGFDGRTPWQEDVSRATTNQEGGDRVRTAVSAAYRYANRWWRADRGGAGVAYGGRETVDGRPQDHLVVTPRGGVKFDAWFDAQTHLLTRIAEDQQFFHTRTFYADYRREGAAMVAHKVTQDSGTGEANYSILTLRHLTVGGAKSLSAYARPAAEPTGGSLDGGAQSVTVPFRLLNNHVYVEGTVNGRGPYTFIVDTGGHTLVSHKLVSDVGLSSEGHSASSGAGEKTETLGFVKVADVAVGGMHLRDQTAFATDVYDAAVEGIGVDGMIGFEAFRRFAVKIDYGAKTLTFTDPSRFKAVDAGTAIPFKFYDHLPQVAGVIDGLPGTFDIDSGSRSEVDLMSPFVARANLKARFGKGVSAITGWGVGGPARAYVVRARSLSLGGVAGASVVTGLSQAKAGSFSDPSFEGNVGSGFLKRFVVTFDYAHQTMWLKPIAPPPADAGAFDRSGMWINASPQGYTVTAVSEGGPAAEAGLAAGDLIIAVNGKPARMDDLSDARTLLKVTPAGSAVSLEVMRAGATQAARVVLRDQI